MTKNMTNDQFRVWREKHFRSRQAAGKALDLDRDTIAALETGLTKRGAPYPVKRHVALACAAWSIGLSEYDGGAVTIG